MRKLLTTAALLGFLGLSSVPAQADVAWLGFGPRFLVGGIDFVLSFGQPGLSYPRGNYYRTTHRIAAHGARCGSACFHSGSIYYHHEGCPLVRSHFARLGYDPYDVYARYSPRAYFPSGRSYCYDDYFRSYGNRGYGQDSRYDRYDHRDRDGRYDGYRSNRYDSGRNSYGYGRGGYGSSYGNRGYGDRDRRDSDHQGHGNYDDRGRGNYGNRGNDHQGRGSSGNWDRGDRDHGNNGGNRGYGNRGGSRDGDRGHSRGNGHRNDSGGGRHHGRSSGSRK